MARVLVISDIQCPFDHDDYLSFIKAVCSKYKIDTFVNVGDEIDSHRLGDYETGPDGMSAGDELDESIRRLQRYYTAFPKMKVCNSNHPERIVKRAFKSGIPQAYMKNYKEVLCAPIGWVWADKHEIDGVVYLHGMGYSGTMGAINAAKDNHKSCVIGHLHADAGLLFFNNGETQIFGMNTGCGIDAKAYAFAYGKNCRKKPVLACGVVLNGRPHLIIMNLNRAGRWDGKI
jgi:hypothetical protein